MNERNSYTVTEPRMMDLNNLTVYLSLGRHKAAEFGKECGAEKHIGRRCLYDKKIIDEAIDRINAES